MASLTLKLFKKPCCSIVIHRIRIPRSLQRCAFWSSHQGFHPDRPWKVSTPSDLAECYGQLRDHPSPTSYAGGRKAEPAHQTKLPPLRVGDSIRLQNQTGLHPKKWDKTGSVIEVKQHDQYVIRVDCSRRVTFRNRKLLRHYIPVRQLAPPATLLRTTSRDSTPPPIAARNHILS